MNIYFYLLLDFVTLRVFVRFYRIEGNRESLPESKNIINGFESFDVSKE